MGLGRPTKYDPKLDQMLIAHLGDGLSIDSFAGVIGVNVDTLYEWFKVHKGFSDAKKQGLGKRALFYEKLGLQGMTGEIEKFNPTTFIWFCRNMLGWRDKQDIEISGSNGGPIKSVAMNINADAQSLTDKELRDAVIKIIQGESANDTTNERTITSGVSDSLRLPG